MKDLHPKRTDLKERVMSIIESQTEEDLKQEFAEIDAMMAEEDKKVRQKAIVSWISSAAMHVCVLLMIGTIAYTTLEEEQELPPIKISVIMPTPPRTPPENKEFVEQPDPNLVVVEDHEVTAEKTIISPVEDLVAKISSEEDDAQIPEPKGREEAVSTTETGGEGAFLAIGPGGGGSGMFGKRIGGGDKRTIGRAFGPHAKNVTTILDSSLRWLKKHQSPNGMWSAVNYFQNCVDDNKCEPGKDTTGADEAMTGYALLCFLGAGYDHHTPNKYKLVVKKGIEYLVSIQKPDGLIGSRNYEHPIAAMALVEAYGMSNDPALRVPAQKAVDIILQRQNKDKAAADAAYAGLGWDYVNPNSRNDSSVTGWNVMTLKSAVASGLNVQGGIDGSKKWLERSWKAANPNWAKLSDPYKDTSIFPYTWNTDTNAADKEHLSFIGALCAVFLGHKSGDIMLESMLNDMDKRWLETGNYKNNAYAIYYASLAAFQSGNHWKKWRDAYVPYLNEIQWKDEKDGCKQGTWNYGPQGFHGSETSRVLIHCYYTLAITVSTRYDMVNQPKKP
jgi:hypothetical protein